MKNKLSNHPGLLKHLGSIVLLGLLGLGVQQSSPGLRNHYYPINKPEKEIVISVNKNENLERKVESFIKEKIEKKQLSESEITAWSVYDFSTGEKLVGINDTIPLQSASMIKPFIALAFYHLEEQGKLSYGPKTKKQMEEMIQNSSNSCANLIMGRIGGPKQVQKILIENYSEIFQKTEIKEYIPKGGKTYRNKSSASDYTNFLYALWTEQLPKSEELKRIMSLPGKDRIYYGVKNIPKETNVKVYNKTGTTGYVVGDMGILSFEEENSKKEYAIVGIIEREKRYGNFDKWKASRSNVIRDFSGLVYEEIGKE